MAEQYCVHCMEAMSGDRCAACGRSSSEYQPLPHHLMPGTVLNGRYVIGKVLGEGGFGITYMGFDTNLEVKVAVKEYYPYGIVNRNNTFSNEVTTNVSNVSSSYEKGKAKFHEEAKTLARFSDLPNIVAVKDFFPFNNTEYIVMEYLEGTDLKDHIEKVGKMSFDEMFTLISPIMACLSKVHQQNLIHRDISPSNIMILKSGRVKLLDFGAARASNVSDEKSLSVMLKPGYAPYEQYSSKGVQGAWTDIYALAATMYKMLTHETPETATDRVLSDELKSIRSLNPEVTEEQEKVIFKAMSIMRQNRYQTVDEFRNACAAVLGSSSPEKRSSATGGAFVSEAKKAPVQNAPVKPHGFTQKYKEDWVTTFNNTVKRLTAAPTSTGNGAPQNAARPVNAPSAYAQQNTRAPQPTGTPYNYAPTNAKVGANNINVAPQAVAKPKKGKGYIFCLVAYIFISFIIFNALEMFTVETDAQGKQTLSYSIAYPLIAATFLLVFLKIGINSYKKTNKLRVKKPGGFAITAIIFLGLALLISQLLVDSISCYIADDANELIALLFIFIYYTLHYLACFLEAKKLQKK